METIQTASEILNPEALYQLWSPNHPGMTKTMFLEWLSTPGIERDIFLQENAQTNYQFRNDIIIPCIA